MSGGYEDDEDYGDTILYTGHGGNDPQTGRQTADQTLTRQNLALAVSADRGLPVRVLRGADGDPKHSPSSGYRYDGLYYVERLQTLLEEHEPRLRWIVIREVDDSTASETWLSLALRVGEQEQLLAG